MDTFLLQHALDSKVAPGENQSPGSLLPVAQGLDVNTPGKKFPPVSLSVFIFKQIYLSAFIYTKNVQGIRIVSIIFTG